MKINLTVFVFFLGLLFQGCGSYKNDILLNTFPYQRINPNETVFLVPAEAKESYRKPLTKLIRLFSEEGIQVVGEPNKADVIITVFIGQDSFTLETKEKYHTDESLTGAIGNSDIWARSNKTEEKTGSSYESIIIFKCMARRDGNLIFDGGLAVNSVEYFEKSYDVLRLLVKAYKNSQEISDWIRL